MTGSLFCQGSLRRCRRGPDRAARTERAKSLLDELLTDPSSEAIQALTQALQTAGLEVESREVVNLLARTQGRSCGSTATTTQIATTTPGSTAATNPSSRSNRATTSYRWRVSQASRPSSFFRSGFRADSGEYRRRQPTAKDSSAVTPAASMWQLAALLRRPRSKAQRIGKSRRKSGLDLTSTRMGSSKFLCPASSGSPRRERSTRLCADVLRCFATVTPTVRGVGSFEHREGFHRPTLRS